MVITHGDAESYSTLWYKYIKVGIESFGPSKLSSNGWSDELEKWPFWEKNISSLGTKIIFWGKKSVNFRIWPENGRSILIGRKFWPSFFNESLSLSFYVSVFWATSNSSSGSGRGSGSHGSNGSIGSGRVIRGAGNELLRLCELMCFLSEWKRRQKSERKKERKKDIQKGHLERKK